MRFGRPFYRPMGCSVRSWQLCCTPESRRRKKRFDSCKVYCICSAGGPLFSHDELTAFVTTSNRSSSVLPAFRAATTCCAVVTTVITFPSVPSVLLFCAPPSMLALSSSWLLGALVSLLKLKMPLLSRHTSFLHCCSCLQLPLAAGMCNGHRPYQRLKAVYKVVDFYIIKNSVSTIVTYRPAIATRTSKM
jgi:hypothetical protein